MLGGASGIGLGITKHFITQADTHITILDINPTTGAQTLNELRSEFPSAGVSFEECDVSSWESQATVFEKIYNQRGRIDIVFANAGITEKGSFLPAQSESGGPIKPNLATLNVNLIGCIYCKFSLRTILHQLSSHFWIAVQLAIHYMAKNETTGFSNGLIVCTASNAGLYSFPMAPMYSATKHGVVGLVRSLSRILEARKIRINALAPAVIGELDKGYLVAPTNGN